MKLFLDVEWADVLASELVAGSNFTQQPPTFASDQTKYSQSNVWVQPSTGNTQGDQANQGSYNQAGFGYSRDCPLQDFTFTSVPFVARLSLGCNVLAGAGDIILAFALFAAYKITAGSTN